MLAVSRASDRGRMSTYARATPRCGEECGKRHTRRSDSHGDLAAEVRRVSSLAKPTPEQPPVTQVRRSEKSEMRSPHRTWHLPPAGFLYPSIQRLLEGIDDEPM